MQSATVSTSQEPKKEVSSNVFDVVVDTGTSGITIPLDTFNAMLAHFKNSHSPVSLVISVESFGETSKLELLFSREWFIASKDVFFLLPALEENGKWTQVLGLQLWTWFDTIQFDIDGGAFEFFARPDVMNFTDQTLHQLLNNTNKPAL